MEGDDPCEEQSAAADECPMVGANGTQTTSSEVGRGDGWRIDVENPKPGVRPGQMHFQDYEGHKYQYNFETGKWEGMPSGLAKRVAKNPDVQRAITKGRRYLGM